MLGILVFYCCVTKEHNLTPHTTQMYSLTVSMGQESSIFAGCSAGSHKPEIQMPASFIFFLRFV